MKIGLFGGAFDPIHNAHLIIAQFIKEELELGTIVFIPSASPPHKSVFAPAAQRLQMVKSSIEGNPAFECSEIELHNTGPSYSVNTIASLRQRYGLPKSDIFWIMGSDNFVDFSQWKEPQRILELCRLVVFPRSMVDFHRSPLEYRKEAIYLSNAPLVDISSTLIRSLVSEGRSISYLVPPPVEALIRKLNLYK